MNAGAWALRIGLGAIVALAALAGIVYATDYGVEATVVSKDCGAGGGVVPLAAPSVTVRTKVAGLRHTQGLPAQQCAAVPVGGFVVYHIRSGRTTLYESEGGSCIYDSVNGVGGCPK
ncbi:MAG TPA: hypothetical protein VM241_03845 [Candidatus Thermoplasmatota archaeon]|nr:hypothetical protein [Candidatus Thermoplasmatota archaeon]